MRVSENVCIGRRKSFSVFTFLASFSTACFIFYRHLIPSSRPPSCHPLNSPHLNISGAMLHRETLEASTLTLPHNKSPSRKSKWNKKQTFIFQFIFASSSRWCWAGRAGKTASGWIVKHFFLFCFFFLHLLVRRQHTQLSPCCVCDGNKWINQWLLCCCLFSLRFCARLASHHRWGSFIYLYVCVVICAEGLLRHLRDDKQNESGEG